MGDFGFDLGLLVPATEGSVGEDRTTQKLGIGNLSNRGAVSGSEGQREQAASPTGSTGWRSHHWGKAACPCPGGCLHHSLGELTGCLQVSITLNCRKLGVTVFTSNSVAAMSKGSAKNSQGIGRTDLERWLKLLNMHHLP